MREAGYLGSPRRSPLDLLSPACIHSVPHPNELKDSDLPVSQHSPQVGVGCGYRQLTHCH